MHSIAGFNLGKLRLSLLLMSLTLASVGFGAGPKIFGWSYSPAPLPIAGGLINVTTEVSDALSPVSSVHLFVLDKTGAPLRDTVMHVGLDGLTYSGTALLDVNTDNARNGEALVIYAVDGANLDRSLKIATQSFSKTPPSISSITYSPSLPARGGKVTVSAKVIDTRLPLSEVTLEIPNPSSGRTAPLRVRMNSVDGVAFTGDIYLDLNSSNTQLGEKIQIAAIDAANNIKVTLVGTQAFSISPPTITSIDWSPKHIPERGGDVTVTARVYDSKLPIGQVFLQITDPSPWRNAPSSVNMHSTDGIHWVGTITVSVNKSNSHKGESLQIVAMDAANNTGTSFVATQGYYSGTPSVYLKAFGWTDYNISGGYADFYVTMAGANPVIPTALKLIMVDVHGNQVGWADMGTIDGKQVLTSGGRVPLNIPTDHPLATNWSIFVYAQDDAGNEKLVLVYG